MTEVATEEENRLRRPLLAWVPVLVLAAVLLKLALAAWQIVALCNQGDLIFRGGGFFELINPVLGEVFRFNEPSFGFCRAFLTFAYADFLFLLPYLFAWTIWSVLCGRRQALILSSLFSLFVLVLFQWRLFERGLMDYPTAVGSAVVAAALILAFLLHRHPFYDRPAPKTISRLFVQKISFLLLLSIPAIFGRFFSRALESASFGWFEREDTFALGMARAKFLETYDPQPISPEYHVISTLPIAWQIAVVMFLFNRFRKAKFFVPYVIFWAGYIFWQIATDWHII